MGALGPLWTHSHDCDMVPVRRQLLDLVPDTDDECVDRNMQRAVHFSYPLCFCENAVVVVHHKNGARLGGADKVVGGIVAPGVQQAQGSLRRRMTVVA